VVCAALAGAALALAGCQKKAEPAAPAPASAAAQADDSMSLGDPAAKVHMEEYASVTCSHCAEFNNTVFPAFKAKYIDTGKVRYTLHELLTPPQDVAAAGFMTARCAGPDKYFAAIDNLFRRQAKMYETKDVMGTLGAVAKDAGLSDAQFRACLADKAGVAAADARSQAALKAGISSTPTFLFNGKKVKEGEMTLEELDAAVAEAAK
jgi:protein-disulfide isomerase